MSKINVIMIGTGEYTTGYVHGAAADSDKRAGVVGLTMIDLRRRGIVEEISMVGTNGTKFPGLRQHLQASIGDAYKNMNLTIASYPANNVTCDTKAYLTAIDDHLPGDVVTVSTPDDTHFEIAMAAVERKCHVLIAKPLVKTLDQHRSLAIAARKKQCSRRDGSS